MLERCVDLPCQSGPLDVLFGRPWLWRRGRTDEHYIPTDHQPPVCAEGLSIAEHHVATGQIKSGGRGLHVPLSLSGDTCIGSGGAQGAGDGRPSVWLGGGPLHQAQVSWIPSHMVGYAQKDRMAISR